MRLACLFGFHGPKVRWDAKRGLWRCASCGAIVWIGSPPGLDQGTLRMRWMTEEEDKKTAADAGCLPGEEICGFQDRGDTGDLVIRYELLPREKLHTIVHEFLHWVASWMPPPIRRTIDYLLDGECYE